MEYIKSISGALIFLRRVGVESSREMSGPRARYSRTLTRVSPDALLYLLQLWDTYAFPKV